MRIRTKVKLTSKAESFVECRQIQANPHQLVETIKSHCQLNLDLASYYRYVFQTQDAILDYTRVIHMRPDVSDYHMARVSAHINILLISI